MIFTSRSRSRSRVLEFGDQAQQLEGCIRKVVPLRGAPHRLGRAFDQTVALGDQLAFDVFGQANTTVYIFYSNAIVNSTSALNLVTPFFLLGTVNLNANGTGALALTIPVLPVLVGSYYFQFGSQNQDAASWGPGVMLSVPEQVVVTL